MSTAPAPAIVSLDLTKIKADAKFQARQGGHNIAEVVEDYTARLVGDKKFQFPPVIVVTIDGVNKLVDGFHRFEAYQKALRKTIPAEITPGTEEDAIQAAATANQKHGARRTNQDKRAAVRLALTSPRLAAMALRPLAEMLGVSHEFINSVKDRKSLTPPKPGEHNPNGDLRKPVEITPEDELQPLGEYLTELTSTRDKGVQVLVLEDKTRIRFEYVKLPPLKEKKVKAPKAPKPESKKAAKARAKKEKEAAAAKGAGTPVGEDEGYEEPTARVEGEQEELP